MDKGTIGIFIIFGVVVIAAVIIWVLAWLIPVLIDGRRLRRERKKAAWRRQVIQHEEGEQAFDDTTRLYPPGVGPGAMA